MWEDDIDKLEIMKSYQLMGLIVKSFDQSKFLSPSRVPDEFTIIPVFDIGKVSRNSNLETFTTDLFDVEIIAVGNINVILTGVSCSGKIDTLNDFVGCCTKCSKMVKLNKCNDKLTAVLTVMSKNNNYDVIASL